MLVYRQIFHQNNPGRTVLEIFLALFAVRTPLSRTADNDEKYFIQFSEKEVDELVDEWTPEPVSAPLTSEEQSDLALVPVAFGAHGPRPKLVNTDKEVLNLASYNFTGLAKSIEVHGRNPPKIWCR
ncbi:hypothetical protein EDB89DRAFT_2228854 [Lactarius sanguifluus]|nr:hypothetical protein EDB89DRAFT_2228854 [Lactarius sanguifluus]